MIILEPCINFLHGSNIYYDFCQIFTLASLGSLKSPLGDTATLPTFGPSGRQERLNCWLKNRQ